MGLWDRGIDNKREGVGVLGRRVWGWSDGVVILGEDLLHGIMYNVYLG